MILVRIIVALLAVPMTFLWVLLLPGGHPSGIPMPWGVISWLMVILLPLLAMAQIFYSDYLKAYLLALLAPVVVWFVATQILGYAYMFFH